MSAARVMAVQRMFRRASAARTLDVHSGLFDDDLTALAERADSTYDGLVTKRLWAPAEDCDLPDSATPACGSCAGPVGLEPTTPRS